MNALTVVPGEVSSTALREMPEPAPVDGAVLLETLYVGICGTDREILAGAYGAAPAGESLLVLGHEALARVIEAPPGSGYAPGDLVVPMVRHPDPEPCSSCAVGEWDMCRNGRYTEHGIKGRHGFARERFRVGPERLVAVERRLGIAGVLLETASIAAKAWQHIEAVGRRAHWAPRRAVVTGAGPVGLLAALMAVQRGLETHVLDRVRDGPKPRLVDALGARYHVGPLAEICTDADVIIECTGATSVVLESMQCNARQAIVCLAGLSSGHRALEIDGTQLNRRLVLENDVVMGVVNANRRHYEQAAASLAAADPPWLESIVRRRVPLRQYREALQHHPGDVKTVLELAR